VTTENLAIVTKERVRKNDKWKRGAVPRLKTGDHQALADTQ